jgi:hypothetical protein
MDAWVVAVVLAVGAVGTVGLVLAGWLAPGRLQRRCLLAGLGAAGVIVGLIGALIQGRTVRVGGSGGGLRDAGDPAGGVHHAAGFDFPLGAVIGLVLLTALLVVAGTALRRPLGVVTAGGGWLLVVALLMFAVGDRGDIILANDSPAQIYVYGGMVVLFGIGVLAYQWQITDRLAARAAGSRPVDRVR